MSKPLDTLYYTRCAVPTPLGIAARLGWLNEEFAADGIQVKAVVDSENAAAREAHYDHSVDNLFRLGGSVPALWARAKGRATRLLAVSWVDEFQGIVTAPSSGLRVAADLRGRRLGLPRHDSEFIDHERASALRGFSVALDVAGIDTREVQFVDLTSPRNSIAEQGAALASGSRFSVPKRRGGERALTALIRGEVDAIYLKGPRGLQLVHQLGLHVVVDIGSHPDPLVRANNCTPRPLTVDEGLLQARPDLVERVVQRVLQAGQWATTHADEAVHFVGVETSTADAWVRYGYGAQVHQNLQVDVQDSALQALSTFKDFLFAQGFLPADFDVYQWLDPQPLAQARQLHAARQAA